MSRDFEFFAVGVAECRTLVWEVYDDDGALIARFDPGAASLPYHFASDGRFRVRVIAVLKGGESVTKEHVVDTRRAQDREIDFHIRPAGAGSPPGPGWEEVARRRTDGNLREAFG